MSEESYFPYCCNVSSVLPAFKSVGERSSLNNYCPVSLLSVLSKTFRKLVNSRLADQLKKDDLFLNPSMVSGLLLQLQIF